MFSVIVPLGSCGSFHFFKKSIFFLLFILGDSYSFVLKFTNSFPSSPF